MKHFLPFFILLSAISCYRLPLLPDEHGRRAGWDMHGEHVYHRNLPEEEDSLYISGVEYPPDYDWIRDTAHSSVQASILLYRGSEEILRVEAGGGALWSVDPDSHRISGGHLYTFAARGGKSFIGKDGEVILEYDGEEYIRGFAIDSGRILTLGQQETGGSPSATFRVDGKTVFRADAAHVRGSLDKSLPRSGALYQDNGHWYFSYTQGGRLHLVEDNREISFPSDEPWEEAIMMDGVLYLVRTKLQGKYRSAYLLMGEKGGYLETGILSANVSYRFVSGNGQLRLLVRDYLQTGIWEVPSGRMRSIYSNEVELFPRPGSDIIVLSKEGKVRGILPGKLPEGAFSLFTGACALDCGGSFVIGLSALDGGPDVLIRDSVVIQLPFNGPITSLSME